MNRKKRGVLGFTLVEITIVVGIVSILVVSFSGYMYYRSKMNGSLVNRQNYNFLQSTILQAAGDDATLIRSEQLSK